MVVDSAADQAQPPALDLVDGRSRVALPAQRFARGQDTRTRLPPSREPGKESGGFTCCKLTLRDYAALFLVFGFVYLATRITLVEDVERGL